MLEKIKTKLTTAANKIKTFLPSKRFSNFVLVVVGLCLVGILFFWGINEYGKQVRERRAREIIAGNEALNKLKQLSVDTDNDGLPDWEENLWKTDIRNPDTDGDGAMDGEETKNGRDPVTPGPNDVVSEMTGAASSTDLFANQKDLSVTERFSRAFFSKYVEARKNSQGKLTEEELMAITDSTVDSMLSYDERTSTSTVYKKTDLKIISGKESDSKKDYFNNVAIVFKNYVNSYSPGSEIFYFKEATEEENPEKIKELDNVLSNYSGLIRAYLNIVVPNELADMHLAILNQFVRMKKDTERMKTVFSDPVLGLLALKSDVENTQKLAEQVVSMKNYILKNNIVFGEDEPGKIFSSI